ncbi:MAG: sigma-70 domain-containing protein [Armatimonadia bacterium]
MPEAPKEHELELWKHWKKSGSEAQLAALLTSLDPLIQKRVNQFIGAPLPRSAIEAEARKQAIGAFQTYKPNMGAALGTHVNNYLQKVYRYVTTYQNVGRLPESRTAKIDLFQKTRAALSEQKGREPTTVELADELNWSPKEVGRMEVELRKDLGLETSFGEMKFLDADRNAELLTFGYFELTPDEQLVFDYSIGAHGKLRLTMEQIAKRLDKTPRQVGLIKTRIVEKLKKYQK